MKNIVQIDEKWFYLTREKQNFYPTPEENLPDRYVKIKRFISKIMFLCAVARPRHDRHANSFFDGKIGIWPFARQVAAKQSSRNRPASTTELKPITVTKEVYREYLISKIYTAIRAKFPREEMSRVIVQHDNAKPHFNSDDSQIIGAGKVSGWNIQLEKQPANSPDLNILDLGFFNVHNPYKTRQARKILNNLSVRLNLRMQRLIR